MKEIDLLKRLYRDLASAKKYLIWGVVLYAPVTILATIQPLIIGYAVQHVKTNQARELVHYAILFGVVVTLFAVLELVQGLLLQISGLMFVTDLRQRAFTKIQKLSMGFLDSTPLGKLLTRLTNDAESVLEMFSMGAVQIIGDIFFLSGTLVMLFFVDVKLSLYSILILPVLALGMYFFRLWTKKAYVKVREVLSGLNAFLQEYLSGIATVQMAGRLPYVRDEFKKYNQNYITANREAIFLDAAIYSFVDAMSYLATALVLAAGFQLKLDHALSLGILVAFLEALSRFFQPLRELSNRYVVFQSALVSLERMYEVFDWPEETDKVNDVQPRFNSKIEFKNVYFSYGTGEPILKDVSFVLEKNQRLALVGHTGAGKSTIIKLLHRFYPVTSGEILIDGRNINDISLGELRRLISVVPQEVFLFNAKLGENLRFGKPESTDDELWQALEHAQLKETMQKRQGLGTMVQQKAANFSLGERQLLAIARAIVTNTPILVMDEATANVDALTEDKLKKATSELLKNRTALVIAHRLSTILDADRIIVLDGGRVVEEGTHQQLMSQRGMYASLIELQLFSSSDTISA